MGKFVHKFDTVEQGNNYVANQYEEPFVAYLNGSIYYNIYGLNGHDYVDLGLPSGTIWATRNLGADTDSGVGKYYQFGHIWDVQYLSDHGITSAYSETTYCYQDIYPLYDMSSGSYIKYNNSDGKKELDMEDDVARYWWGGSWETPTREQLLELINYTNVSGSRFTSKVDSSKYISLPAGNARNPGSSYLYSRAIIVSKTLTDSSESVYHMDCYNNPPTIQSIKRYGFCNIRPVITPKRKWYNRPPIPAEEK